MDKDIIDMMEEANDLIMTALETNAMYRDRDWRKRAQKFKFDMEGFRAFVEENEDSEKIDLSKIDKIELLQAASEKEDLLVVMCSDGNLDDGIYCKVYIEGDLKVNVQIPIDLALMMLGPESLEISDKIMQAGVLGG